MGKVFNTPYPSISNVMRKIIFIFFWLILQIGTYSQTINTYIDNLQHLKNIEQAKIGFEIKIIDQRWSIADSISVNKFQNRLFHYFEENGIDFSFDNNSNKLLLSYSPLVYTIEVKYLNFYESAARNLFGQGILDIKIFDKEDNSIIKFTSTVDIPLKGSLRAIDRNRELRSQHELKVIDQLIERLDNRLNENIKLILNKYRTVTSIGYSVLNSDYKTTKERAVISALRNACNMAWGSLIDSRATMIDYGDVSEITEEIVSGHVITYIIMEEYIKSFDEEYLIVKVKSLIKQL